MTVQEFMALAALVVVLVLAFQISEVLVRVALALFAILIVIWLISRLFVVAAR